MTRRLLAMAAVMALVMGLAVPAAAAPTTTEKMTDFYTTALQGPDITFPGDWQWVFCSQATRTVHADGSAVEEYRCELSGWVSGSPPGMGANVFDPVDPPDRAMRFDTETDGVVYFSDFLFLGSTEFVVADEWFEQVTPSGKVHFRAVYYAP